MYSTDPRGCSRSCDRLQADRVRGKVRKLVARRYQSGTDGTAVEAQVAACGV